MWFHKVFNGMGAAFFLLYTCQFSGILGLYCDTHQLFHADFPPSPWRGREIPLSCNQSCCLFSCQTWGAWVFRSLSLLVVLPSLPKCSPSLTKQHMRVGLVYTSSLALFRQVFLNEAEHKLSGGPPVTRRKVRWISLLSYLLISGGCSPLCCGLLGGGLVQIFPTLTSLVCLRAVKTLWQLLPTMKSKTSANS